MNQPGPRNEPLQCRILRQRVGTLRAADQYILQLDNGGHFLMAARKRKKSKCSNYLISLEQARNAAALRLHLLLATACAAMANGL